jgi:hypothetical protein
MPFLAVPDGVGEIDADCDMFDQRFTPTTLLARLQEHSRCFVADDFGGTRCVRCRLPAIYRTLYLSILVHLGSVEYASFGGMTTRVIPVCKSCHGWQDQAACLCLTLEDALAKGFLRPVQNHQRALVRPIESARDSALAKGLIIPGQNHRTNGISALAAGAGQNADGRLNAICLGENEGAASSTGIRGGGGTCKVPNEP